MVLVIIQTPEGHNLSLISSWMLSCLPLGVTVQPIPHQLNSPFIESISLQFKEKDVAVQQCVVSKALQKSRKVTTMALPLATDGVTPCTWPLGWPGKALPLVFWNHFPVFRVPQFKGFSNSGLCIDDFSFQAPSAE